MNQFAPDSSLFEEVKEPVHSLSEKELEHLKAEYTRIKDLIYSAEYEMSLEDQKIILQWRRADRETKFTLNKVKAKAEKGVKPAKVKKPKKLSQKALGLLYLKELKGDSLTEEEERNRKFTLTGED